MTKTIMKTKSAQLGLTDYSRADQSLIHSELRYRRLFETAQDGILILDAETGMINDVNPYLIKMLGYSRAEFIEKKLWQVGAFKDIEASKDAFKALQKNEYIRYENLPLKTKDGRLIQVEFVSNVYLVGEEQVIQCNIRDITAHKRLRDACQENERKYRTLVTSNPDGVFLIDLSGHFLSVNQAICDGLGFSEAELRSMNIWDIVPEQYLDQYKMRLAKILNGEILHEPSEYTVRGKDGKILFVEIISAPYYGEKGMIGFQGIARDITARKRAEEALRRSEARYRTLVEQAADGIFITDVQGKYLDVNTSGCAMLGYTREEILDQDYTLILLPEDVAQDAPKLDMLRDGKIVLRERRYKRKDGTTFRVEISAKMFSDGRIQSIVRDVTARRQAQETLRQRLAELEALHIISTALRTAQTRDEALPILLDETLTALETDAGAIWLYHADSGKLHATVARGWYRHLSEISVKPDQGVAGTVFANGQARISAEIVRDPLIPQPVTDEIPAGWGGICLPIRAGAITVGVLFVAAQLPRQFTPEQMKLLESLTGIAGTTLHRMSLHEETVRQLDFLEALHSIDSAIGASTDLQLTLNILIHHVKTQLNADATDVLLLDAHSQTLEYAVGLGFRTRDVQTARLRLGDNFAGRIAIEHRAVRIDDPAQVQSSPHFAALWAREGFANYYGIPLIAKGEVKGVLEVYHRGPFHPEADWISFLETLAGQAAIAIDSVQLFENLQRSNTDLARAYDATIEGWSRAMDLRDHETEGHTQRVTETSQRLAREMGIEGVELVQMRRGGLLHDIGKMGVPDSILLKPGSLTDLEWAVMQQHPDLVYQLLSPIEYLRPALDIPYCHHEKWDGTGYPRGLKGNQIPLSARIFAVVDVWDALRSDRSYRKAWDEEEVRDHIRSLSGTHFDPTIVPAFLRLMELTLQDERKKSI